MSHNDIPRIDDPEILASLDSWTRERVREQGSFTLTAAGEFIAEIRGLRKTQHPDVRLLVEQLGDVIPLSNIRRGYTRTSVAQLPATLASLIAAAERDYFDPRHSPESGRRATRDLVRIGRSQLTSIKVGAAAAAQMITGNRRDLERVGRTHFTWVSGAGEAGRGEWQLVLALAEWSDCDALAVYEQEHGSPAGWDRRSNADRRKKQTAGVRLLLDLAATHRLIPRGGDVPDVTAPAAAWEAQISDLYDRAVAFGSITPARHDAKSGVRLLALYATRLGHERHETTNWSAVRDTIIADHKSGRLTYLQLSNARYAYNGLVAAGALDGDRWQNREDRWLSVFEHGRCDTTAENLDFSAWRLKATEEHPESRYPAALIDGTDEGSYGLRDYCRWTRLEGSALAAERLPARLWVNPTPGQRIKAAKKPSLFRLVPYTLASRLRLLSMHAGWVARKEGIDWAAAGLEVLCDPANLRAHLDARGTTAPDHTMASLAFALGVIASPYLEATALQRAALRHAAGDEAAATAAEEQATRFRKWGTDLRVIGTEQSSSGPGGSTAEAGKVTSAREIRRIWRAWTADGRSGWHKLALLRDEIIAVVEREGYRCASFDADGQVSGTDPRLPLNAQAEAIRNGAFTPTLQWATAVRDAAVVTLVHRIPLRPRNVVELTLDEWMATRADGLTGQPWEGAIQLEIPAQKMKGKTGFQPPMILRDDLADADVLASVRHDLWEVYFMSGGARDELLRLPNGAPKIGIPPGGAAEVPWVFPSLARRGHVRGRTLEQRVSSTKGLQWQVGSYAKQLKSLIRRYADVLKIDLATLDRKHGALTGHIVRHLFGSHHCDEKRWDDAIGLVGASKMLAHSSVAITESRYVGKSESDVSVGRRADTRRAIPRDAAAVTPASESPASRGIVDSLDTELERLNAMHDDGRLRTPEFEALRAAAISRALGSAA